VATPEPVAPETPDQAYSDYEAAAKACNAKNGVARSDCIRDAREARDKAMETANPTMGGVTEARMAVAARTVPAARTTSVPDRGAASTRAARCA
jgi:hypothetical protein